MGVSISRQMDLSENVLLQRFVGKQPIPVSDEEFWTEFLQYQIALPNDRSVNILADWCPSLTFHFLVRSS